MKEEDKARELIEKFKDYVNPYMGSGMLSNTYDDSAILMQSKKCAEIVCDEVIYELHKIRMSANCYEECEKLQKYWEKVNSIIKETT